MKELTICMTHYNRKLQLLNTLASIERQGIDRNLFDIVIVDDVSDFSLEYYDFYDFDLDIKLITIQTKNKWWLNPCIGFNTAFNFVNGKRTIIQNSECLHKTNIIEYVLNNLKDDEYVAMSTLNLTKDSTLNISAGDLSNINEDNANWYCHSVHSPRPFNFCAAIYSENLKNIGGFDNRFAEGIYFDDDYLLFNLRKNNIHVRIEDSQVVYHQWHESLWGANPNFHALSNKNYNLLNSLTQGE